MRSELWVKKGHTCCACTDDLQAGTVSPSHFLTPRLECLASLRGKAVHDRMGLRYKDMKPG
jgi:hypothetical protein